MSKNHTPITFSNNANKYGPIVTLHPYRTNTQSTFINPCSFVYG